MDKSRKAAVIGYFALVLVLVPVASADAYSDVVAGLTAQGYTAAPGIRLSWSAVMHQDTFPATDLIESGGGPAFSARPGGYLTVGRVLPHPNALSPNAADRIVMYGAGNVFEVSVSADDDHAPLPVDSRLKVVLGNLTASNVELISAGDTEVQGTANAIDSLTGITLQVPASRFVDSNNDGILIYRTTINSAVIAGADKYYDYNRDGQIVDARLDVNAPNHQTSDRPFIAVYETRTGAPINLSNPPAFNADGDASGSRTDNLWLGNPYARVNADTAGGPRGIDGESPAGTPEADPNIMDIDGFYSALLIGEIKDLSLITIVNLSQFGKSNTFFVSNGEFDAEITDGRLYEWYASLHGGAPVPAYSGVVNASLFFDLPSEPLSKYEYVDDGTFMSTADDVPEPATLGLLLGPALALALRRRMSPLWQRG